MSKIAVLIPSYKPEDYLLRCFKSLEKQTISKDCFCVYIALNGPGNPYEMIIHSFLSQFTFRYKYIYLEKSGVSHARNCLIDLSSEPFIAFIDDDDLISDNYLSNLLMVADNKYMAISNISSFEKNIDECIVNYIGTSFSKIKDIEISKYKSRKYYSSPWAKLLHRDMIAHTRFNTALSLGEDSLFMTEISNRIKGVVKTTDNTYYYVCNREGSATRKKTNLGKEIKRLIFLEKKYLCMIFGNYDKVFILTRVLATFRHLKKIIK